MAVEGMSMMTIAAIVVGGIVLVVAAFLLWDFGRRGAAPRRGHARRRPRARAHEEAPGEDGATLRLDEGGAAEATIERPPEVERDLGGGTLRLVNTCPNHPERRARWTCRYCRDDFCDDCRRYTQAIVHCPGERCAVRAANAVATNS